MQIPVIDNRYKPGDVVTMSGGILVNNPTLRHPDAKGILTQGVCTVTLEQAEEAEKFGWTKLLGTRRDGCVQVSRGVV